MKIYHVLPERIVFSSGVENASRLLRPAPMQIGIGREETATLAPHSVLILDYGREIVGGVRILSYFSEKTVPVRLRFGESVAEVCAELGEKNATNDHALRDFRIGIPQLSDGVYGDTGFRFLRIDVEERLSLTALCAVDKRCELPLVGSFSCNDPRVNEIYETARETLLCCVQNGYIWDGVKRDRLVWIGDLHPEMMGLLATVGGCEAIENCLRLSKEQTPLPGWINGIPSYSLWWIVDLHDYYAYTGDVALLREHAEYLQGILQQVEPLVSEKGETAFPYDFLDWPTHGTEDELAGQAGLLALAMRRAVRLSSILGLRTPAEAILERVLRRRDRVKESKQSQAIRALAGLAEEDETRTLLLRNGAHGISTFMSYYILRALAQCGRGADALTFMKEYYGGMLDAGARTFWEDFSLDWRGSPIDRLPTPGEGDIHGDNGTFCYQGFRHSLCHGWSCGPIPFLMHTVLGVGLVQDGCKRLTVRPSLCGLTRAEGSYPTPLGPVRILHEKRGEKIVTSIDAPDGVTVVPDGVSLLS